MEQIQTQKMGTKGEKLCGDQNRLPHMRTETSIYFINDTNITFDTQNICVDELFNRSPTEK